MYNKSNGSKYFLFLIFFVFSFFLNYFPVEAVENTEPYLSRQNFTDKQKTRNLTIKGLFVFYFNSIWEWIPDSYKYIDLKFLDVQRDTKIYDALQKWVYLDLINNKPIELWLNRLATQDFFAKLIKNNFELLLISEPNTPLTLDYFLRAMSEIMVLSSTPEDNIEIDTTPLDSQYEIEKVPNFPILNDVYLKIKSLHYDSEKFKDEELLAWAIKWIAESTWDKYTTYFPPIEAKNFNDGLAWEFEWIGAHVEMIKPWIMTIIAPISWSPAEKAWIMAWDQVLKIDSFEVTEKITLQEAVNKIKWKTWTTVKLNILRGTNTIEIIVTRAKIIIDYVVYKKLDNWNNYIKISTFWLWAAKSFSWIVDLIAKNNPNSKTIIDLRNNPGWSLDEVATMLEYFVPNWESVVNIKYKNYSTDLNSSWYNSFSFIDKNVLILINKWSASASEIMAWTIRDYLGNSVRIIWETSYWKWSVQSLNDYSDWSSFKYTVAKWFTGKTKTGIDWVWIKPDIEIKPDQWSTWSSPDRQLDFAKNFWF